MTAVCPILMTTIAMVLNVPNCVGIWSWSRMEKRFSMGSIGGLISSLFLTLVIPVIYEIMEKLISKFTKETKYEARNGC
jgi:HAE1 family hydrophobic/amphiphilic exporter-1